MGIVAYAVHLVLDLLIGGRYIPTIIAILAAVVVYFVIVLKIGTLSEDDIEALPMGARLLRLCKRLNLLPSKNRQKSDVNLLNKKQKKGQYCN